MSFSAFWQLLKETYAQWSTAKPFQLAAALAYYTLFSLAPLLLIAIAIAGLVFGRDATEHQILTTFQGLMGPQGAHEPLERGQDLVFGRVTSKHPPRDRNRNQQ